MTIPLIDRVHATLDGYTDARTILTNASKVRPAPTPLAKAAHDRFAGIVRAHLLSGEPIPDDAIDEVLAAEQAQARYQMLTKSIGAAVQDATNHLEFVKISPSAAAFGLLNQEIQTIVGEVRDLIPTLDGATTADTAVKNGSRAVAAWESLQDLASRYDEARRIQFDLTPTSLQHWDKLTSVGLYRNALAVSEFFARRSTPVVIQFLRNREQFVTDVPPLAGDIGWWPTDVAETTALLRIVTYANPWVPTPEAMESAWLLATSATSERLAFDSGASDDEQRQRDEELRRRVDAYDEFVAQHG